MNAETFNSLHKVGTPVFAYPGFRPEDASDARRLVTRTRTAAQLSASGDPVVWVEGEGSYICLTHVDVISEDEFKAARAAETAAAVAALGALPMPVGDQPQPLDDTRLAEALAAYEGHPDLGFACCSAHAVADHVSALLAEVERLKVELVEQADVDTVADRAAKVITSMGAEIRALKQERNRYRLAWQSARERAQAYGEGILRHVADRDTWKGWCKKAEGRVAELEQEQADAVAVSEALYQRLTDEKLASSALYAALTMPTTPEQRQAALDRFLAVAQRTGQLHGPSEAPTTDRTEETA